MHHRVCTIVYAPVGVKKSQVPADRLLRKRSTFSKSVMVSVAVSKLGCTELMFVEPGAKVNGVYYREVYHKNCFLQLDALPVIFALFSRIMHRRIVHVKQFNCCEQKP